MANFNFNSVVPDEGTTLLFGLWIFIDDGIGSFISHLVKIGEFEASAHKAPSANLLMVLAE